MSAVDARTRDPLGSVVVGLLFCVSGVSALIYQVAWQRILALHSGVGIYSVAMIVAAFLAGIGIGSYVGGKLSVRRDARTALRTFAVLELLIGLFAAASCALYYDLLYVRAGTLYTSLWRAGALHFAALLVPTTLMGMSLPFLAQAMVRDPRTASRTVGYLYGINVLGAALGAFLTPWVFIRLFGIRGAVFLGAGGNVLAGLAAIGLSLRALTAPASIPASAVERTAERAAREEPERRPFPLWLGLYTLTGFCSLALEILWFRVIDVAVKSTAFTFGTVLAVFLAGLGLGSLFGGALAMRVERPLRAFLVCQCLLIGYAGLAIALLTWLPLDFPVYRDFVAYWQEYEEFKFGEDWDWGRVLSLHLILPAFLYGVPTLLMGLSFGILQRAVQDARQTSGFKVGVLQAGNIVGNVAGSLIAGLVLLHLLGTAGSFRALVVFGVFFALLGAWFFGLRGRFGLLALGLCALAFFMPDGEGLWRRLHGASEDFALFREDASGVTAILPEEGRLRVSINGKGHSHLPFGGLHSLLGSLPAAVHPAPESIAIIGLGSGDTAWAAACRPETRHVTVFEISATLEGLLEEVVEQAPLPQLTQFVTDPRLRVVAADGRNALILGSQEYDLIEADALRPHSAYSGNLYSVDFFRLLATKLRPGGLMCTWAPTEGIYSSFFEAFPYVVEFLGGSILVGSNEPISVDLETWYARLASPAVSGYLGPGVAGQALEYVQTGRASEGAPAGVPVNRDLFPRDEFRTPR